MAKNTSTKKEFLSYVRIINNFSNISCAILWCFIGKYYYNITYCDADLDNLVDKEINLLKYLETKILGITLGDKNIISKTF